jgi:uncharacterized protein YggU (UPF0235/DUF167 family)
MALPKPSGAVRYLKSTGARQTAMFQVFCRVKPGVSAGREGIVAVTDECVEINVTNRPIDGGANTGVEKMLARALSLPRTHVKILKGLQSREKTFQITIWAKATPEEKLVFIRNTLMGNVMR